MAVYVALLRSVNVGGTGKLPMGDLKSMCEELGFEQVRTYIASGNALFRSSLSEAKVKAALEKRLAAYAGRMIPVLVRTAAEMSAVFNASPFKKTDPARTVAIFLDKRPDRAILKTVKGQTVEEIKLGTRELYVHYGAGIGNSRLRIPSAERGTARNLNTVRELASLGEDFR